MHHSDVNVNSLIIKLVKFHLKLYCVSFNDSYPRQSRVAQEWLQVNCRKSSETISDLQIRLSHGLQCLGAMLEACHQFHPNPKSITERKEVLQLWSETAAWHGNRSTRRWKAAVLWLKTRTKADEHTNWLSNIRHESKIPLFEKKTNYVLVTLFCSVSAQAFFIARKSLSGHAKIWITLVHLKIIKCHSAFKCR